MTQEEEKQLLLKDLCARVPYHPKGHVVNACNGAECDEWLTCATFTMFTSVTNNCRLYLRPTSSMTEKEIVELKWLNEKCDTMPTFEYVPVENYRIYDWMNRHHFDFRNLIEKGLALEAPADMYNIEEE